MTTAQSIRERIAKLEPGKPFKPSLFANLGARSAIDQTLMRLNKSGMIERIGHGLYMVPKSNRFGLKVFPAPDTIAQTIAAEEGVVIEVHGAEAARRLGLSTQVPTQAVFYTTGSSRELQLGKQRVYLQHVAPRKLVLAGRPAGQALSALWYLGKSQVSASTFKQIEKKLPSLEFEALRKAKSAMPAWMVEALRGYEEQRGFTHE